MLVTVDVKEGFVLDVDQIELPLIVYASVTPFMGSVTGMLSTVNGLITETLSLPSFGTYTMFVIGLTATAFGPSPAPTVAITAFVAPSITDTVSLAKFDT